MSEQTSRAARRGFLSSLAGLPLIGGSVALIGSPTRADVVVTPELLATYDTFLDLERRHQNWERANGNGDEFRALMGMTFLDNPAGSYDFVGNHGGIAPSARAAVLLSAAGCGWRGRGRSSARVARDGGLP